MLWRYTNLTCLLLSIQRRRHLCPAFVGLHISCLCVHLYRCLHYYYSSKIINDNYKVTVQDRGFWSNGNFHISFMKPIFILKSSMRNWYNDFTQTYLAHLSQYISTYLATRYIYIKIFISSLIRRNQRLIINHFTSIKIYFMIKI